CPVIETGSFSMLLRCENISFSYSGQEPYLLNDFNLSLELGEFTLLQGKSGCGKTTLLKILGGLIAPLKGRVLMGDFSFYENSDVKLSSFRQENIGFIFQEAYLEPQFTVWENILLPLYFGRQSLGKAGKLAGELLEELDMIDYKDSKVSALSGGQRQRVATIRAFINKPMLILADEPIANLDDENSFAIFSLWQKFIKEKKISLVMTSHFIPDVLKEFDIYPQVKRVDL
ncbi:ATP-binding cassette domain-containing protein, partial [bacterium]|nr:ATP-binding cassette domain-containing protein [bacterium]